MWVEENLYSDKNVSDLTRFIGYSRRIIEIWFSNKYGLPPGEYLSRRRMTRAAVLLKLTNMTVTDIGMLLGHSGNQNFARAFRRFMGVSPVEYRKSSCWRLSVFQLPLLCPSNLKGKTDICQLPDRYIQGEEQKFFEGLNEGDNGLVKILRPEVTKLVKNGGAELYLAAKPVVSNSVKSTVEGKRLSELVIGHECAEDSKNAILLPGGTFCRCQFSCRWEDYFYAVNYFFITGLSEMNKSYSGAQCYVRYYGCAETVQETVFCELYIPLKN